MLAENFINDNGISAIALAFFGALFTAVSATVIGLFKIHTEAKEAKNATLDTRKEARQARVNTQNIANGFANNVDRKLDHIIEEQDSLGQALREHLSWHVKNPAEKR
jgi:hypothetical protein